MIYLFTKFGIENYDNLETLKEETKHDLQHSIIADEEDLKEYKELYENNLSKFFNQFHAAQQNARRNLEKFLQNN